MSDHNIQIAVDSRKAQAGVKQFTGTLNDAFKALRRFDQQAKGTFAALDKLGKTNLGGLQKSARGTAEALNTLNKVRVSKALVGNLQSLQKALSGFRFNAKAITAVPDALRQLNRIQIDSRIPTVLNALKASLVGFRGPPKGAVDNLIRLAQGLALIQPGRIEAAANALAKLNGFKFSAPRSGIGGLGNIARQTSSIRGLQSQLAGLSSSFGTLRTAVAGVSATMLARGVYATGNAFQVLQRTLGTVATSTDEVATQMAFLTGLTDRMPISLEAVAESYGRFAIAARLSGITASQTQKTFEGFATAFSAMGVGAEAQRRGFLALIQMMSKGRIQSEEIRQQLAEALPGAMTLLAESMGVTTAQLSKMLEEGKVLSSELPKMADLLQSRFGPAVEMAMQRASAQLTNLGNEWVATKRIIFDSGFEAGLGSFAKALTDAMKTSVVRDFARDLGRGLEVSLTHLAAFVKTVSQNAAVLKTIFAAVATVVSAWLAKSLLFVLGPAIGLTITAFKLLGKAALGAQARLLAIPGAAILGAVALDQLYNKGRATTAILDRLASAAKQVGSGMSGIFGNLTGGALDGLGDDFAKNLKEAQDAATAIQNSPLFDPAAIRRNGELEADNAAKKLAALTDAEQAVWDEVNAVGKANSEYLEQLALLDAIAAKKGINVGPMKAALAASTLDDRNPAGALARDLRADLATLTAKTGVQKALNQAQQTYNDLLARGQDIGAAGLDALKQYYAAIARMNGEIGNGFERWAATVGDWNDQMQDAIKDGIGGLSDEITNFVTGAEADFAGLARSILRTFVQISLDSLLKDLFGAMGMDPAKQSASLADQALQKLAGIGENITTMQTNVYTSGLSINGVPLGSGPGTLPSTTPGITRAPLANIPGTIVLPNGPSVNDRFPLENLGLRGTLGSNTTPKTNRVGYVDPERFAPGINPAASLPSQAATAQLRYVNQQATRNMKLTESMEAKLRSAVGEVYGPGARADIYSGGQPHKGSGLARIGSTRHDGGMAADAYIYDAMGKKMRGDDLAPLAQYWQAKGYGGTGLEMKGGGIHLDEHADRARSWSYGTMTGAQAQAIKAGQAGYMPTGIDPMTTQGIDSLNTKLQTIGTTAAQTAPAFDQLRAANQNLSSASTMAGTNVQMAGTMASSAGPQFTTAGTAIQTAGQSAAAGAQAAQTAAPSLNGFGNGISQLLGPLSQAIPGLGQFGGMIMQLLQSLFSGGGGLMGGLFAEGGISGNAVARASLPAAAWAGAAHYAEGIANTSGGMPAILHPNEAVIPLTRGREVPVQINDNADDRPSRSRDRGPSTNVFNFNGVKDADTFRQSKQEVKRQMISNMKRAELRG